MGTEPAPGPPAERRRDTRYGALIGTFAAIIYGVARFRTTDGFLVAVDQMPRLFFDFVHYYDATARSFAIGENEALGYLYSPLLAVFLIPLAAQGIVFAMAAWALIQALCIALLIVRACELGPPGFRGGVIAALLTLLSTATLHSFKWGQIGLILAVLMMEAILALARRRDLAPSVLLGSAIALKFYPAILWPLTLATRRWRTAIGVGLASAAFLLLPAFAVLGIRRTRNFYRRLSEALSGADGVLTDPNSQAVAAWLRRTFGFEGGTDSAPLWIGVALVLLTLYAAGALGAPASSPDRTVLSGLLLTSFIPFFAPTCWASYFCTLPALTLLTAEMWRRRPSSTGRTLVFALLTVSGAAQVFPAVDLAGGWLSYVGKGWLLLADLTVSFCGLAILLASSTRFPQRRA